MRNYLRRSVYSFFNLSVYVVCYNASAGRGEATMQSYSQDLRDRVLWALERGEGPTAIARRLEVSRVWVYRVRGREQTTGERTSHQIGADPRLRFLLLWHGAVDHAPLEAKRHPLADAASE